MGKRIHALNHISTPLNGAFRIAIDNPGWTESVYATLAEVAALITTHNPITIANPNNGLSVDVNQVLSIAVFDGEIGVVPACDTFWENGNKSGAFLNANGDWVLLITEGLPDSPSSVIPPSSDGNFALDTGKLLFGSNVGTPDGIASLYSDTAGEIKTDEMITSALGFKPGTGSTLLEIGVEATLAMTATGNYIPLSIKEGGTDKIIYIPTFELSV